ncbi:AMP-dependent synthetase/ligase [Streptomyces sp. NPDC058989]|uniref:AMP-dependent synthetase/ligase n=1 Tax=Streptomyces sp. NPDC058989 TaxID=3346686 RepID=UPI0036B92CBA
MREFAVPPMATCPPVGGLADVVFERAVEEPDLVQLRRKVAGEWHDVTAVEFRDQVMALAKGLLAHGVRFGDRVAIMSRTRYEWTLFDFALWTIGGQPVPVYPTASADQLGWILQDTRAVGCVVEHEDHAMTLGSVVDRLSGVRRIWQLDAGAVDTLVQDGLRVPDSVIDRHRRAVTPSTAATVIYTSGTSGSPKGCVLTHSNLSLECDNLIARWPSVFSQAHEGQAATLLFLPLAHVFGRVVEVAAIRVGGCLGHQPEMTVDALLPALASFQPTFLLAVPDVFEKLFQAAFSRAQQAGQDAWFAKAVDIAVRFAEATEQQSFGAGTGPSAALRLQHRFFDRLVYRKIRAIMGGRLETAVSGGSTMGRRLGLFFHGAGMPIYEGYGLTESTAAATVNLPERVRCGTVGRPIPGVGVRITDEGEILLRGSTVFSGYLNDPQLTGRVLRDGWLHTGDLGFLDEDGYLTITGRKKEVIVTSSGKTLSPMLLESRVCQHPLIERCIVVGNDRPYVAALATLDHEALAQWARMCGKSSTNVTELVRDPDLVAEVQRAIVTANVHVSRAESIRSFRILPTRFIEGDGTLTPSGKVRRWAVEESYAREVDDLYAGKHQGTVLLFGQPGWARHTLLAEPAPLDRARVASGGRRRPRSFRASR